jgi:hypothetical protein
VHCSLLDSCWIVLKIMRLSGQNTTYTYTIRRNKHFSLCKIQWGRVAAKLRRHQALTPNWTELTDVPSLTATTVYGGGEYEDGCLMGCCAVYTGKKLNTFHMFLLFLPQPWWRPLKCLSVSTRLHGATSQKTAISVPSLLYEHTTSKQCVHFICTPF